MNDPHYEIHKFDFGQEHFNQIQGKYHMAQSVTSVKKSYVDTKGHL